MNKNFSKFLVKCLLPLFLLVFFSIPIKAKGNEKSYTIENLLINATITKEGNLNVEESITYNFKGNFNGINRSLSLNGCNGYKIQDISVIDNNNVTKDVKYEVNNDGNYENLKVYSKSENEKKTFKFKYTVLDNVKNYGDFGQLNWDFYDANGKISVDNVKLTLSLQNEKFDLNTLKYTAYVDDGGFQTSNTENSIILEGKNLTSLLALKVDFQPNFLTTAPINYDETNDNNYNANDKNNIDNDNKSSNEITEVIAGFVGLLGIIGGAIFFHNKKTNEEIKSYRDNYTFFKEKILKTPPSNMSPALVNLLVNKKLTIEAIPATLFYLCKLGYYDVNEVIYKNENNIEEKDLYFTRKKDIKEDESSKGFFIHWFKLYEVDFKISLKHIEKIVASIEGSKEFKEKNTIWENILKEEANTLGFYTKIKSKKILTNEYENEKIKWLAYKAYLVACIKGNSTLLKDDINRHLIYALALNVDELQDDSFINKLNDALNYDDSENIYGFNFPYFLMYNMFIWNEINDNIVNNINSNNLNNSNSDNFSGFSGGSDFSGGGGGGSDAF
ncbi:DUF2207 domain-containing protein [Clostridium tarantellae]|uniref:DUF2207 domain-containing protein n=1 Tax=Clostridium tarantellae TaxID=39493 RepID=A0A6I1MPV8_9CLOT|nr:DUF2207 domain-containing protein [Clostridium tarantellae]MPQ44508.1 DUF2207 domain-containing protein [Clostridium tarantellae]